jgi:hypothetical protein
MIGRGDRYFSGLMEAVNKGSPIAVGTNPTDQQELTVHRGTPFPILRHPRLEIAVKQ